MNVFGKKMAIGMVSLLFLVSGILSLLLFAGFSKYVKQGGLKNVDFATTVKIQERIDNSSRLRLARAVGEVMEGSTFFASPGFSSIVVIVIATITFIKGKTAKQKIAAFAIPVAFALLVLGEIYGKSVVHHPAPPFFMIKNPTTIFPKYYINEQFSYPSGHAARAVFLGIIVYFLFFIPYSLLKKNVRVIGMIGVIGYIGLVSISRIYLGHHWLSDILGGGMLGTGMALLSIAAL